MSRYTKHDLRQELIVINNMVKNAGCQDELTAQSRNGYVGLDVNDCQNIYCGTARECKGRAWQWCAEQLHQRLIATPAPTTFEQLPMGKRFRFEQSGEFGYIWFKDSHTHYRMAPDGNQKHKVTGNPTVYPL